MNITINLSNNSMLTAVSIATVVTLATAQNNWWSMVFITSIGTMGIIFAYYLEIKKAKLEAQK